MGGMEPSCSAKVVKSSLVGMLGRRKLVIGRPPDIV